MRFTISKTTFPFTVLVAAIIFAAALETRAQHNFFVRVGGGYQHGTTADSRSMMNSAFGSFYSDGEFINEFENETPFINYGTNAGGRLEIGYGFGAHFSAGLAFSYHVGLARTWDSSLYTELTFWSGPVTINEESSEEYKSSFWGLTPQVAFWLDREARFCPYVRGGAIIAFPTTNRVNSYQYEFNEPDGIQESNSMKMDYDSQGRIAVGLDAGLGAEFKLNERVGLYAEARLIILKHKPETLTINEYEDPEDPANALLNQGIEYTYTENTLDFLESDFKLMQEYMNLSSIGLTIGASFYLF